MVNREVPPMLIFPWEETYCDESHEKTSWKVENVWYVIYQATLKQFEAHLVVPHILSVKNKIEQVMEKEDHFGPSLFQVFPRTLKPIVEEQWNRIVTKVEEETRARGEATKRTGEFFHVCAKAFVEKFVTPEETHLALQQLCMAKKPRNVDTRSFMFRMQVINSYLPWLPGNLSMVNEDEELKHFYYNAMPESWKSKFKDAGNRITKMNLTEVAEYFKQLERSANYKQQVNEMLQWRKRKMPGKREEGKPTNHNKRNRNYDGRIKDEDICPIHAYLPKGKQHIWGNCYSNAKNKGKERPSKRAKHS
jgi:hypothetical protein